MRSPDIEMAVRLYYEKPEITNADIAVQSVSALSR